MYSIPRFNREIWGQSSIREALSTYDWPPLVIEVCILSLRRTLESDEYNRHVQDVLLVVLLAVLLPVLLERTGKRTLSLECNKNGNEN